MRNQRLIQIAVFIVIAAALYFLLTRNSSGPSNSVLTAKVEKGPFTVAVTATGELEAKRSKKIMGPQSMRNAQIYETTIQRLVPEGTVVSQGDFVAQLDKTEIANRVSDIQTEIDKINTQLDQAKIDTSIEMRGLRDQLNNIKFSMEETKLQVELNRYEPQAVIRQKNIEYEKIQREFEQVRVKLGLTEEKNKAKIAEIKASLKQQQVKVQRLNDLAREFTVKAPADGMVIYARTWNGKVSSGSQLRAWDPVVAELPDLTEMISKTYVNEVDISKVSIGQETAITVDAFPDKTYTGVVTSVANIGEQLRDYDTKVFEVLVSVNERDSILRPAMTTGIEISINKIDSTKFIPIEAIFKDSLSYVFVKNGAKIQKQEVVTGFSNDVSIMILGGLDTGQEVLLNEPADPESISLNRMEEAQKGELLASFEKKKEEIQKELAEKKKNVKNDIDRPEENNSGFTIIF